MAAGLIGVVLGVTGTVGVVAVLAFTDIVGAGEVEYGANSAAARVEVRQCVRARDLRSATAATVPCRNTHAFEVYARRPALVGDDVEYPDENLGYLGEETCFAEFEPYVATPWNDSALEYTTYVPSRQAWNAGQRDIVCALYDPEDRSLEGSSEDSGD